MHRPILCAIHELSTLLHVGLLDRIVWRISLLLLDVCNVIVHEYG